MITNVKQAPHHLQTRLKAQLSSWNLVQLQRKTRKAWLSALTYVQSQEEREASGGPGNSHPLRPPLGMRAETRKVGEQLRRSRTFPAKQPQTATSSRVLRLLPRFFFSSSFLFFFFCSFSVKLLPPRGSPSSVRAALPARFYASGEKKEKRERKPLLLSSSSPPSLILFILLLWFRDMIFFMPLRRLKGGNLKRLKGLFPPNKAKIIHALFIHRDEQELNKPFLIFHNKNKNKLYSFPKAFQCHAHWI